MAKAVIKENYGDGRYSVEIQQNTAKMQARLTAAETELINLEGVENKTPVIKLQILSVGQKITQLKAVIDKTETTTVWCADLQTDLSGEVGVVNVPDEPGRSRNIKPGTGSGYVEADDGDKIPIMGMDPETAFYLTGLLPGVQRWKPQFRYGKILSLGPAVDECNVLVLPAFSSQQNLAINPESTTVMQTFGTAAVEFPGWDSFVADNPGSPIASNTDAGSVVDLYSYKRAQLEAVNTEVNNSHTYKVDAEGTDTWGIMSAGDTGDCEDFALTKMQQLIGLGWSAADLHIVACTYADSDSAVGHAVLSVDTDKGSYILDNRFPGVSLATDSTFSGYTWGQKLVGGVWQTAGVGYEMQNVPVEYMECGAAAFQAGDEVLLSFSGSWDTPKVVGFAESPQACGVVSTMGEDGVLRVYDGALVLLGELVTPAAFDFFSTFGLSHIATGVAEVPTDVPGVSQSKRLTWCAVSQAPTTGGWWANGFKDYYKYYGQDVDGASVEIEWKTGIVYQEYQPFHRAMCLGPQGIFTSLSWANWVDDGSGTVVIINE